MNNKSGFTLIELMIAVAIVGVLAAIAIPSYQDSIRKSRRADAEGALMNFANGMERHYTEISSYCDAAVDASKGGDTGCGPTSAFDQGAPDSSIFSATGETKDNYSFFITVAQPSFYTLRAEAIAGTTQETDGFLELDSTGARRWDKNNNGDATEAGEDTWD